MSEQLSPERAARLLRAKAAELEVFVKDDYESNDRYPTHLRPPRMTDLTAAVALVAQLLADHIESVERLRSDNIDLFEGARDE